MNNQQSFHEGENSKALLALQREQDQRMQCLTVANYCRRPNDTPEQIISAAAVFFDFITKGITPQTINISIEDKPLNIIQDNKEEK